MRKGLLLLGVFAVFMVAAKPAGSCDTYVFSYSNSSAMLINGMPVCAGTGGNCYESGSCSGTGYCVDDGSIRRCYRDVP